MIMRGGEVTYINKLVSRKVRTATGTLEGRVDARHPHTIRNINYAGELFQLSEEPDRHIMIVGNLHVAGGAKGMLLRGEACCDCGAQQRKNDRDTDAL
jgi:hypothetical protein